MVSIKRSGEPYAISHRPVRKFPDFLLFTALADLLRKPGLA
jgi:hypothetical protein